MAGRLEGVGYAADIIHMAVAVFDTVEEDIVAGRGENNGDQKRPQHLTFSVATPLYKGR